MKKILLTVSACASLIPMMGQELLNSDFSGEWVDCIPWTSSDNKAAQGTQPEHWTISNVIGIGGLGATTVGFKDEAANGDSTAVKLVNCPNPFMASQIVPGYLTLGTTWSTAAGFPPAHKDGGTFGGTDFTYTPDAVAFKYKRAHAVDVESPDSPVNEDEAATVVAYLWKGTYSQADVPGDISLGATNNITMIDRDRNILGMATAEGGEVTESEGAALIGKLNYAITGNAEEWTEFMQPIEYLSDEVPEKFNLIIAANDYFGAPETVGCGNTLVVDDVKLIYYSRLASFEIGGQEIPGFDSEKYEYDLVVPADANPGALMATMKYPVMGHSAVAIPGFDPTTFTATLTVKNQGPDIDGESEHVYTFHIIVGAAEGDSKEFVGRIDIDLYGEVTSIDNQTLNIIDIADGHCTLALYHFSLGDDSDLGDIIIENVAMTEEDGVITYKGAKEGLALAQGSIIADVTCEGTQDADGIITMDINVLWKTGDGNEIPIKVTFTNDIAAISDIIAEDAPAEYYHINGIKATGLNPGLYIKVQGGKATKVLVK